MKCVRTTEEASSYAAALWCVLRVEGLMDSSGKG